MNNVHFACIDCKSFIDAGYRWAYWSLEEPGIVSRGVSINIDRIFAEKAYWQGWKEDTPDSKLKRQLIQVRRFLETHKSHDVVYGTIEDFGFDDPDDEFTCLEWLDDDGLELLPRYFAERLGCRNWSDVQSHVETLTLRPWWWDDANARSRGWRVFRESLTLT